MTLMALAFMIPLQSAPAPAPGHCELVATLNRVVAEATGYHPPACPQIGFAALPAGGALRSQGGAFFPDTGRIELAPDLDLSTTFGQSYLLHELVHAAQYANGADKHVTCPAQLEAEAYYLQSDFLRDRNLPREAVLVRLLADHLGHCGDPDY